MAGVSNLLQRMTSRKTNGFNVWPNPQTDKPNILDNRRSFIEQSIPKKDVKTLSADTARNLHTSPSVHTNNTNNNNFNNVEQKKMPVEGNRKSGIYSKPAASTMKGAESASQQAHVMENQIGNYRFIRTLGKGTFAKVKLAVHGPTGKEVAIKIIDKTQLNESDLIKMYREIRIMKILNHPNIVRLYEVIENEKYLHLVLEFVPKGEIFEFVVKNGRLQEMEVRKKFRQIISAIEYCHRKCIVHRDLKVENLLLDSQMGIKICDFGFSNEFSTSGKLNTFCGSPPYAAPELFLGKNYVGPEVDVWSLGVVLYTLLCGALPFDGRTVKELKERIMKGVYHVPAYLSQPSREMLKKFLCVMPSRRISLQAAMNEVWMNVGNEMNPLKPFIEEPDLIDFTKIEQMVKHGYDRDQLIGSVKGECFDPLFATYQLTSLIKQEKLPITRTDSNPTFLSTPLRRSLRDHNVDHKNNKLDMSNNLSMRIPQTSHASKSTNHASSVNNHVTQSHFSLNTTHPAANSSNHVTQYSNRAPNQTRASGAQSMRGSRENVASEVVLRSNPTPPDTKFKRATTGQAHSQSQKYNTSTISNQKTNGLIGDYGRTNEFNQSLKSSFKSVQPIVSSSSNYTSVQKFNSSTICSQEEMNGRLAISSNEPRISFTKKPKPLRSNNLQSVGVTTKNPNVLSHHKYAERTSNADLSTMGGHRMGSRSVSMKGSTSKLISSSKTNLVPRQTSLLSLNAVTMSSNPEDAFVRHTPTRSTVDVTTAHLKQKSKLSTSNKSALKNGPTNGMQNNVEVAGNQKNKSTFGNWFKGSLLKKR